MTARWRVLLWKLDSFAIKASYIWLNIQLSKANKQLTNGALTHNFESPPSGQNEQQLHMDHSL